VAEEYKRTILIVDNRIDWQKRLESLLSPEFQVAIASSYSEAVACLSEEGANFHVVVTEISLDEKDAQNLDGFRLVDDLKTFNQNILSIMVIENATSSNTRKAFKYKKVYDLFNKTPEDGSQFDHEGFVTSVREAAELAERSVFLIMPYAEEFVGFHEHISDIIDRMGLACHRADDAFQPDVVMAGILGDIRSCGIAVADLSGANPNVYFETGIAHAMGKKVILLTRSEADVINDLRALRYMIYEDSLAGAKKLGLALPKAIEDVRRLHSPVLESIDGATEADLCLVLVKDDIDGQDTYQQIIEPVLEYFALQKLQIKDVFDARNALSARRTKLHSSLLILADVCTKSSEIFYLSGYAYGLGKDVIYLAHDADDIPFDLRISSSIIYAKNIKSAIVDAQVKLTGAIEATLQKSQLNAKLKRKTVGNPQKTENRKDTNHPRRPNRGVMKKNKRVKVFINHANEDKSLIQNLTLELKRYP